MKKLYIPTSTLNFNNILSSESISPKAFYSKRNFGIKRWINIPENNLENAIVLYSNLCYFERPKSDLEDNPMTIEIEVDDAFISELKKVDDDIFLSDKSIFLNPWNTTFFFNSVEDKVVILSMSNNILENKLVNLYKKRMRIITSEDRYKQIENIMDRPLNEEEIKKDYLINKMKGCLYGYYIGGLLSTTEDHVKQLNILREIKNIFVAIHTSIDKQAKEFQKDEFYHLYDKLLKCNPMYKKIQQIVDNKKITDKSDEILCSLEGNLGCITEYTDKKSKREYLLNGLFEEGENNLSIAFVDKEIKQEKDKISEDKEKIDINKAEIVLKNLKVNTISIIEDYQQRELFKAWVNETLLKECYDRNISSFTTELSDDITTCAKEIYESSGGQWDTCEIREKLNSLRKHIQSGEEFRFDFKNDIISSIAAVLTNGNNWEKLLYFMQSKNMTNYKLAFAMFGTLNGFADLTRDFTDVLLTEDREYVADVYCEFYYQLFGKEINKNKNDKSRLEIPSEEIKEENMITQLDNRVREIEMIFKGSKKYQYIVDEAKNLANQSSNQTEFLLKFKSYAKDTKIKSKGFKSKLENWIKNQENTISFDDKYSNESNNVKDEKLDNNMNHKGILIIEDKDFENFIRATLTENNTDDKVINKILKDYIWLLDEMRISPEKRQYYRNVDNTDNNAIIEKLYSLRKDKNEYDPKLREILKTKLKERYCSNE